MEKKDDNEGVYCSIQETNFFTTGYFRRYGGFCIPQIQNSVTEEEIIGGHGENKGYTIYSINEVLGFYNEFSTKEEYLSNSNFDNVFNTALYSIKFMVTTTKDWLSAFVGISELTKNVYDLYAKASTKNLMSYRKILYELKEMLIEKEMYHKEGAQKLAKEMESMRDKNTFNYENKKADYYMHVYWGGDFEDQKRAVKHEIDIVEYEIFQREPNKTYM